jgi:hypothetical protein
MLLLPEEGIGVVITMNLNDEATPSRFYQIHPGIAQILLGGEPRPLTSYEDPLSQYGKQILGAAAILMAVGVAWALRRIRRWRRNPASAPSGRSGLLRHVVLPLVVDLGVTAFAWWLVLSHSPTGEFPVILRFAPDIGLSLVVIAILGIGWGLLRTAVTLQTMRPSQ